MATAPFSPPFSQVEQCLSILQNALHFTPDGQANQVISFDFDDCCAYQCVLEGLRGALRDVVDKLDGYQPRE